MIHQSLNGISDSITKAAATPKEIKIAEEVVVAESIPLTSKDIYRAYWHCRDFEINHLWQHSIFLTTFMVLCFSAYGYLAMDMLSMQRPSTTDIPKDALETYWLFANGGAIFISYIGAALSVLWIAMAKGSKAWFEIYETAIAAYETNNIVDNNSGENDDEHEDNDKKIGSFLFKGLNDFKSKLEEKKFDQSISNAQGGAYSPSRINWAIGQIILAVWGIITFSHILIMCFKVSFWYLLCLIISIAIYFMFVKKIPPFLKSNTILKHQQQ